VDDTAAYESNGSLVVPWRVSAFWWEPPSVHEGEVIELLTPEEFAALPDGTVLICIDGKEKTKGVDDIDLDTRFGRIAWGVPDRRAREP
jgi:hypothetical protein